jgi:hypothetical protein
MRIPRRAALRSLLAAPVLTKLDGRELLEQGLAGLGRRVISVPVPATVGHELHDIVVRSAAGLQAVHDPRFAGAWGGGLPELNPLRWYASHIRPLTHPDMQAQIDAGFVTKAELDATEDTVQS